MNTLALLTIQRKTRAAVSANTLQTFL